MVAAPTATATATYSTAGTVSSPLDLDAVRGEYSAVSLENGNGNGNGNGDGGANGTGKRRTVRPKPKVTLTSLTVNNVSGPNVGSSARLVRDFARFPFPRGKVMDGSVLPYRRGEVKEVCGKQTSTSHPIL